MSGCVGGPLPVKVKVAENGVEVLPEMEVWKYRVWHEVLPVMCVWRDVLVVQVLSELIFVEVHKFDFSVGSMGRNRNIWDDVGTCWNSGCRRSCFVGSIGRRVDVAKDLVIVSAGFCYDDLMVNSVHECGALWMWPKV